MSQMTNFESLPSEIIKDIICLSEAKSFYHWSLVNRKIAQICRNKNLIALTRERLTITKAWITLSAHTAKTITTVGDEIIVKYYRCSGHNLPTFQGKLTDVYHFKGGKYHSIITFYYRRYGKKRECGKYSYAPSTYITLYDTDRQRKVESYDMGIRHGWWSYAADGCEVCYDHGRIISFRNKYTTANIINGKVDIIFEREYHHRTEYFVVRQDRVIYMHIKLGEIFEYIDGGCGKDKEEGGEEVEDEEKENEENQQHALKQLRSWLSNHKILPISVDLTRCPRIILDPYDPPTVSWNHTYRDTCGTKGWRELVKCN